MFIRVERCLAKYGRIVSLQVDYKYLILTKTMDVICHVTRFCAIIKIKGEQGDDGKREANEIVTCEVIRLF